MKTSLKIMLVAAAGLALPAIAGAADAKENWTKNCQKCHAADGSGNTAIGKKFKIRNYTDAAVQAELKDEEMFKATKEGLKDDAGKTLMPGYADKLSDDEIHALVALIRSMKQG